MQKQLQPLSSTKLYKVQERWMFHARIRIKIPVTCNESLFNDLYALLEQIDKTYNSYNKDSYISRINQCAGSFVEVDNETVFILQTVKTLADYFDGVYDITLMPLIRLWGFYDKAIQRIPSQEAINRTLQLVDYRKIEIEGNSVRIGKGQELITGSFIKAYAVDQLTEKLKSEGITDAIINAGGSTIMCITDETHPYWQINVQDPEDEQLTLYKLHLSNGCFSTSSQSIGFIEVDGKKYGHILNAKTGYPTPNKQTGIISEQCFIGDILSTAFLNTDAELFIEKLSLISSQYKVEGFLIDAENKVAYGKKFKERIRLI